MYEERILDYSDWMVYTLLLCIVLLTLLRIRLPYRFKSFLQLAYQSNFIKHYNRDIDRRHLFTILTTMVHLLSNSLFLYIWLRYFTSKNSLQGFGGYIQTFTLYSIFVLGKMWIEQIIGITIKRPLEISNYVYEKLVYKNLLSLYILVCNILLLYTLPLTEITLIIITLSIVFLNVLSLLSIYKRNSSHLFGHYFYFILYLCALEIAPYILVVYAWIDF